MDGRRVARAARRPPAGGCRGCRGADAISGTLILIVEDERDLAATCARILTRLGHPVVTANSREAGRAQLVEHSPGLVVCDVRLPDGSGLDFVRESRPIPAVVMTGQPSERGHREAIAAGACAYLAKPFGISEFTTAVKCALETGAERPGGQGASDESHRRQPSQ